MEVDDSRHGLSASPRPRTQGSSFTSDPDAEFAAVYDIDLSTIRPIVAKPHFVDNVVPAKGSFSASRFDEAFLGSCNNGRLEDLRVGAANRSKAGEVSRTGSTFLVVSSRQPVRFIRMPWQKDLLDIFMEARRHRHEPQLQRLAGEAAGRHRGRRGARSVPEPESFKGQVCRTPRILSSTWPAPRTRDGLRHPGRDRNRGYGLMPSDGLIPQTVHLPCRKHEIVYEIVTEGDHL